MSKKIKQTERLLTRPQAARALGISIPTLRKYEADGVLRPTLVTPSGRSLFSREALRAMGPRGLEGRTLVFVGTGADASSAHEPLVRLCEARGWAPEVVGAGGREELAGMVKLLEELARGAGRLVLASRDAVPAGFRDGVFAACAARGIEVVILPRPATGPRPSARRGQKP